MRYDWLQTHFLFFDGADVPLNLLRVDIALEAVGNGVKQGFFPKVTKILDSKKMAAAGIKIQFSRSNPEVMKCKCHFMGNRLCCTPPVFNIMCFVFKVQAIFVRFL